MKYRIDEFFDRHLVPLVESRGVSFTFSKTFANEFFVKSSPNPTFPSSVHYSFSLIERGGYTNALNASYYLLSLPKESIPSVSVDDSGHQSISFASPFSVTYDPVRGMYLLTNPFVHDAPPKTFSSFSQVVSVIDRKWYMVNVQGKDLVQHVRPEILSRKGEDELHSLLTDPFVSYLIDFLRDVTGKFGKDAVSDINFSGGSINVILSRRAGDPGKMFDVYRTFLDRFSEDLKQTISRRIVPVVI